MRHTARGRLYYRPPLRGRRVRCLAAGPLAYRREQRPTRSSSPVTWQNTQRKDLGLFTERKRQGESDREVLSPSNPAEESRNPHDLPDRAEIRRIFGTANSVTR